MKAFRIKQFLQTLLLLFIGSQIANCQTPGVECGCDKMGEWKSPASKAIKTAIISVEEGSSPGGTYTLTATNAQYPYNSFVEIKCGSKTILSVPSLATGWGFSPDGHSFVMHGFNSNLQHIVWLYNLNPNPSVTGEKAELVQTVGPTALGSASIRYSPHGKYLLYAGIGNSGALMLYIYSTKDGSVAYSEVGGVPITGWPNGKSVAFWGFSSDSHDRTFVHAFLTNATTYGLVAHNLETKTDVIRSLGNIGTAEFKFSKCGDFFLWSTKIGTNSRECRFYKTSQENFSPSEFFSGSEWVSLETNAENHVLKFLNDPKDYTFENTANNPCADGDPPTWPPGASLVATNPSGTTLDLSWDAATDSEGTMLYRVYQDGSEIVELEDYTSFEVSELEPEHGYTFKVEAGDESDNWTSNGPSVTTATVPDDPPEWDVLSSLSASKITGTSMKLTWSGATDVFGIVNYSIYKNGSLIKEVDGDSSSYTVKGLEPLDVDTFKIEAGDAAGHLTTDGPSLFQATNADDPPYWNPGEGIYGDEITETTITFHWDPASNDYGSVKYKLYRDDMEIATVKSHITTYTDDGLEGGTSYTYAIEAIDEAKNVSTQISADLMTIPAFVELPLVIATGAQWRPDIDERLVVWEDKRNANLDIYEYNLRTDTEAELMVGPDAATQVRTSDGRVVWADYRNGTSDIYMTDKYDPEHKIVLVCGAAGDQLTPSIDGNIIVWTDDRNGNWDIYMHDLVTGMETAICTNSNSQINPDISGHIIVWEDARNGNPDIYGYNLAAEEEFDVCTRSDEQRKPAVQTRPEYRILWQDNRSGNWDIYMQVYYVSSYQVMKVYLAYTGNQTHPDISDDVLVYQDDGSGNEDIYAYHFKYLTSGDIEPICLEDGDQLYPRTSGGRIVWEDHRNDEGDIYIWDRPPGTDLSLDIKENKDPVEVGKTLIYTLTAHNFGPDDEDSAKVICTLPVEAQLTNNMPSAGTVEQSGLSLTWTISALAADSSASLELSLETFDLATLKFQAAVSGKGFDPEPSNNSISESTEVKRVVGEILEEGVSPALLVDPSGAVNLMYGTDESLVLASKIINGAWEKNYLEHVDGYHNGDMVKDSYGRLQLSYSDGVYGRVPETMLYHQKYLSASTWSNKIIALSDSGFSCISMGANKQSDIHMLYLQSHGVASPGPFKHMKFNSGSWSGPNLLYKNGYEHIDMVMDDDGYAHTVYIAINQGPIYQKSLDNELASWTTEELVEENWMGGQLEGMVVDIDLDDSGQPHVIYPGGKGDTRENIMYAYKTDDVWQNQMIDIGFNGSASNAIAVDDAGKVHVCYYHLKSGQLRYATNVAGPWIKQNLDAGGDSWGSDLDMAMDALGNVHIAYVHYPNVKYALRPPIKYFTVEPDTLDFGALNIGEEKTLYLKLRNLFAEGISIDSVGMLDGRGFNIDCPPFTILKGVTDSIAVCFAPSESMRSATHLRIYFTSNSKLFMDLPVLAETPIPDMKITPDPVLFGYILPLTQEFKTVTIENTGSDDLIISDINVKYEFFGYIYPTDFSLVSENCTNIPPGGSCEVEIEFYPKSVGSQTSYLNITSNDFGTPITKVSLSGNAQNPTAIISISPSAVDFGYAEIGATKTETVTITSYGDVDLEITNETLFGTNIDQFSYSNTCTTLAQGESCDFTVSYTPTESGTKNAGLNVYSNALYSNPFPLTLTGNTIKRELTPSVASIDFGSVEVGSDSSVVLTFTNTDVTDILVSQISVLGLNLHEFKHIGWSGMLLAGESFTDTVSFSPLYSGEKSAYLQVQSNDSESPTMLLPLTGIAGEETEGSFPEITISATPLSGPAPLEVSFNSVLINGSPPYTVSWNLDEVEISTLQNPTYVFSSAGSFTILAKVSDAMGQTDEDSVEITVTEPVYSISGSIFFEDGSAGYTSGTVELYAASELTAMNEYDLNGTGLYTFEELDAGSYTLKFLPEAVADPDALPTYLGDVLLLSDALFVLADQDLAEQDINVITMPQEGEGSGQISGMLVEGDGKKSTLIVTGKKAENASALQNIFVYLTESGSHSLAGSDLTDQDGNFEFNNLDGSSYIFQADYMGIPMDEDNPLLVLEDMEDSISIIARAGADEITYEIEITGIRDRMLPVGIHIYPNPVREMLLIRIDKTVFSEGINSIFLIGIQGVVAEAELNEQNGSFQSEIAVDHLTPGIYILRLEGEDGVYNARVVVR